MFSQGAPPINKLVYSTLFYTDMTKKWNEMKEARETEFWDTVNAAHRALDDLLSMV